MPRRRKGDPVHGWVILDKPVGMSSQHAVSAVRRLFNARKAGHAGTLDPLADGVLPIALGEATKTVQFVTADSKSYRFTVVWGAATSTDDAEGEKTQESDIRPDRAAIEKVLSHFTGEIRQVPPAYSAIKVDGERAYKMARRGDSVELSARTVRVDSLGLVDMIDADRAIFEMSCGKGTYVRSLARDLATALGTVGHVAALRRTRVGRFSAEEAISLSSLEELGYRGASQACLLPVVTALDDIPALAINGGEASRLRRGQPISLTRGQTESLRQEKLAYTTVGGDPVALGEYRTGQFFPTRVFNLPVKWKGTDVDYS